MQATIGEPPGRISLNGAPGSVLMFNISPVQGLRQTREGRSFVSDMLHGEMTLMPPGVPSWWSWNSVCDRLDVIVSPDVFGDGTKLEVMDRFAFRDSKMEMVCNRLYRELSLKRGSRPAACGIVADEAGDLASPASFDDSARTPDSAVGGLDA